jgi:hypothetical protein
MKRKIVNHANTVKEKTGQKAVIFKKKAFVAPKNTDQQYFMYDNIEGKSS